MSDQCGSAAVLGLIKDPGQGVNMFSDLPRNNLAPYHSVNHHYVTFMENLKMHVATIEHLEQQYDHIMSANQQTLMVTELQNQAGVLVGPVEHATTGENFHGEIGMKLQATMIYLGVRRATRDHSRYRSLFKRYLKELESATTPDYFAAKAPPRLKQDLAHTLARANSMLDRVQRTRGLPGLWSDLR